MKDKPNEWVSISDLMSGVMAVVMLLLVMSVLQKTYAELKHKQEIEQGGAAQKRKLDTMLGELQQSISAQGAAELVAFDIGGAKITLKDNIFQKGSACITTEAAVALKSIQGRVSLFLKENEGATVFVEGHTDNIPVSQPVTDYSRFCTVYDDNFTLSAARAREARKLLIGNLSEQDAKKFIVAGYGDSQPLSGLLGEDAKNRRVEVQFMMKQK